MLEPDELTGFLKALGGARPKDHSELEAALGHVLERAQKKWPEVTLAPRTFFVGLGTRLREASSPLAGLSGLRTSDLYAAMAAARGDEAVMEAVLSRCARAIDDALRPLDLGPAGRDEVVQKLRERMFLAQEGKAPRIASYSGTGSLAAWLSAAAVRVAIDLKRGTRKNEDELDERLAATIADTADVELRYIKERYRREFRDAFQVTFQALTLNERNLLRLAFLDRLSIDELATMLSLHRSTVARRLAKLRDELAEGTKVQMRKKLKLSQSELDSLMRLVTSAFDVSLGTVFRSRRSLSGKS